MLVSIPCASCASPQAGHRRIQMLNNLLAFLVIGLLTPWQKTLFVVNA